MLWQLCFSVSPVPVVGPVEFIKLAEVRLHFFVQKQLKVLEGILYQLLSGVIVQCSVLQHHEVIVEVGEGVLSRTNRHCRKLYLIDWFGFDSCSDGVVGPVGEGLVDQVSRDDES